MHQAIKNIDAVLTASTAPAVMCSFGKDSLLLLDLVRERHPNVPVIWFRNSPNERFAKQVIAAWNLMVFSWAPAEVYLLRRTWPGHNEGTRIGQVSMVHEYGFGEHRLPVLTDLAPGRPCQANRFQARTPALYLPFDTIFIGWRDEDSHWVKGRAALTADGFEIGRAKGVAPLRHMTESAVRSAIIDRKIPFEPTPDELLVCPSCLASGFCEDTGEAGPPTYNLDRFRARFDLKED
jgi:hypothetical protein